MLNGGKLFTLTTATRSHRQDVNDEGRQRSTFNQMRTFLREICVPLQLADPLKSTASAALQNGLMFQPHSESTSFTSMGQTKEASPQWGVPQASTLSLLARNEQRARSKGEQRRLSERNTGSSPVQTTRNKDHLRGDPFLY